MGPIHLSDHRNTCFINSSDPTIRIMTAQEVTATATVPIKDTVSVVAAIGTYADGAP